jgi:putative acyl-CoA dehydrogenase
MQNVLVDLALESQAATLLMMRLAQAYDHHGNTHEDAFRRLATAVGKYWLSKRAPIFAAEALECLGGAGYVEESILPRIYRETPLNSVWEGSGNVICLDVLRAIAKEPETLESLSKEINEAGDARLKTYFEDTKKLISEGESQARRFVERLALALQSSLLLCHSSSHNARTFLASRLEGSTGRVFGVLESKIIKTLDAQKFLQEIFPE